MQKRNSSKQANWETPASPSRCIAVWKRFSKQRFPFPVKNKTAEHILCSDWKNIHLPHGKTAKQIPLSRLFSVPVFLFIFLTPNWKPTFPLMMRPAFSAISMPGTSFAPAGAGLFFRIFPAKFYYFFHSFPSLLIFCFSRRLPLLYPCSMPKPVVPISILVFSACRPCPLNTGNRKELWRNEKASQPLPFGKQWIHWYKADRISEIFLPTSSGLWASDANWIWTFSLLKMSSMDRFIPISGKP